MRSRKGPLLFHFSVGVGGCFVLAVSNAVQEWAAFFVWLFGVPWLADLIALLTWHRSPPRIAWVIPAVALLMGGSVWLVVEATAGVG